MRVLHRDGREYPIVRLGFNYVRGLRSQTAQAIVAARHSRQFASMRDLRRRVPSMNKKEFSALAELGALNALPDYPQDRHRRGALWHATAAAMPVTEAARGSKACYVASALFRYIHAMSGSSSDLRKGRGAQDQIGNVGHNRFETVLWRTRQFFPFGIGAEGVPLGIHLCEIGKT